MASSARTSNAIKPLRYCTCFCCVIFSINQLLCGAFIVMDHPRNDITKYIMIWYVRSRVVDMIRIYQQNDFSCCLGNYTNQWRWALQTNYPPNARDPPRTRLNTTTSRFSLPSTGDPCIIHKMDPSSPNANSIMWTHTSLETNINFKIKYKLL